MDRETTQSLNGGVAAEGRPLPPAPSRPAAPERKITRRQVLKYGLGAAMGIGIGGGLLWRLSRGPEPTPSEAAGVFKQDAPSQKLWDLWLKRGWVKEARHYLKLGRNVQCRLCPNHCLLEDGDRSHCRNKINRGGTLYTLAYADPCALHVDPIEKKPLFHFLPGSRSFSLATAGCVFRCLNCQNWDISQRKPEETKDATGEELRLTATAPSIGAGNMGRLSLFPDDVAALAAAASCASIAYTYSEPVAYYEYAQDTCKAARQKKIRNVLVTCGYIEEQPLRDLAQYVDGAHVDLKGFDEATYRQLNTGSLQPVLNTLKTLKSMGVWVEVVNLVVPTYTDKIETIKRMCSWLLENLGPDAPLHFSRFMPMHKLTYLPPTPVDILLLARQEAMAAGLRYVYVGNVPGQAEVENTFCPNCRKAVLERNIFSVTGANLDAGKCKFCRTAIAGVWE